MSLSWSTEATGRPAVSSLHQDVLQRLTITPPRETTSCSLGTPSLCFAESTHGKMKE